MKSEPTQNKENSEFYTVAVISVTAKPLFLRNRCKSDSASRFFFRGLIIRFRPSSISPTDNKPVSVHPESSRFDVRVMEWMDLALLWNWVEEEQEREGRVAANAASIRAISSSLMISMGIGGRGEGQGVLLSSVADWVGESAISDDKETDFAASYRC